jgi:hypothetical protein
MAVLAIALLVCATAKAGTVTLAWTPSAECCAAGYLIYYGNDGTNFQCVLDAGTNTTEEVGGLQEGETNTFAVTAYDFEGFESPASNLISYIVPGTVRVMPRAGPRSPATLRFPVAPGHTYQVQASVNLTTWSTIWQTTATNNVWTQFQDVEGANLGMRFYRLAWQ